MKVQKLKREQVQNTLKKNVKMTWLLDDSKTKLQKNFGMEYKKTLAWSTEMSIPMIIIL